ncbi:arsenate reductase (glutaredoxin) [Halotalea alkalilenta]|uniref:Arsenate reductase n=1 Tax=Halotalea alkalilenta TaxID=376489 RepID=A0A172YIK2_9GAMM|nr:arsenate reductase (glutaredoxin) [Halotalea alkalilenta]ANF58885.1 arsenate reductase (glutaredoxin) [Halotalea alkalilenta]
MQVTLYHNGRCGTSRKVLDKLRAAGIEPAIVEYLKTPLDHVAIEALLERLELPARGLLRTKEALYRELGLDDPALDDAALIEAMVAHPILIERPIVVCDRGARICRPAETLDALLG